LFELFLIPMKINMETVQKMAHLARLDIPANQLEATREGLERMVGFVEKLQELDTTGVKPLAHPVVPAQPFRADVEQDSLATEQALEQAPGVRPPFFTVPTVIKK
jgi:aspartyl-tRNA(Asn)/glutamyl-tRNA(Gln) amidotransferase subunit C